MPASKRPSVASGQSLSPHVIAAELEREILAGKFVPGARFATEYALCARFDVSRTPVREALRQLQAAGLIVSRHGSGTFVADRSADRVAAAVHRFSATAQSASAAMEMMEARLVLETGAAWRAAERSKADPAVAAPVLEACAALEEAKDDLAAFARADAAFHHALMVAGGNLLIESIHAALMPALMDYMARTYTDKAQTEDAQDEHWEMAQAVAAGDPPRAAAAVSGQILRSVREALTQAEKLWPKQRPVAERKP